MGEKNCREFIYSKKGKKSYTVDLKRQGSDVADSSQPSFARSMIGCGFKSLGNR